MLDIVGSTHVNDYAGLYLRGSNSSIDGKPLSYLLTPRPVVFISLKPAIEHNSPMGPVGSDISPFDLLPGQNLHGFLD